MSFCNIGVHSYSTFQFLTGLDFCNSGACLVGAWVLGFSLLFISSGVLFSLSEISRDELTSGVSTVKGISDCDSW